MAGRSKNKKEADPLALPSVLAFEGKIVCSDALMYEGSHELQEDPKSWKPIRLQTKTVRATMAQKVKDTELTDENLSKPQPLTVDAAALGHDQDTLRLVFTLKLLGGLGCPVMCSSLDYRAQLMERVHSCLGSQTLGALARRYAMNIANGRFLFRNRTAAERVEIRVRARAPLSSEAKEFVFADALDLPLKTFVWEHEPQGLSDLTDVIRQGLEGEATDSVMLEIEALARIGHAQTVYPSQEFVQATGTGRRKDGEKSKVLYSINEQAAMHSQKIGNALRTIDDYYPDHERFGPIAVEPYGAVTTMGTAFRKDRKCNFYSLLDDFVHGRELRDDDLQFLLAVLIRGGVFGETDKKTQAPGAGEADGQGS